MLYTVTFTTAECVLTKEFRHIADALGYVLDMTEGRVLSIHLITDVAQLGEYLEKIEDVWVRVVRGALH